jgi:hypothetical protein
LFELSKRIRHFDALSYAELEQLHFIAQPTEKLLDKNRAFLFDRVRVKWLAISFFFVLLEGLLEFS